MQNKRCDRCKSVMLREEIPLTGELFEPKTISSYHCMYCGRSEYGTDVHPSITSRDAGT
jgi:hypothetical protein